MKSSSSQGGTACYHPNRRWLENNHHLPEKAKGIEIGKREIDEVPQVEATPRYNAEDAAQIGSAGTPESTAAD